MNNERSNFFKRVNPDVVLALAIIHHLSISNNISFEKIAEFFAGITSNLIIEFVPKSDSQVKFLLSTKMDTFEQYTQEKFEENMCVYFRINDCYQVGESNRIIYHFERL